VSRRTSCFGDWTPVDVLLEEIEDGIELPTLILRDKTAKPHGNLIGNEAMSNAQRKRRHRERLAREAGNR
jgi:hypothetical protein